MEILIRLMNVTIAKMVCLQVVSGVAYFIASSILHFIHQNKWILKVLLH